MYWMIHDSKVVNPTIQPPFGHFFLVLAAGYVPYPGRSTWLHCSRLISHDLQSVVYGWMHPDWWLMMIHFSITRFSWLMDVSYGWIIWPFTKKQLRVVLLSLLSHQCAQWLSAGATILAGIPVAQVLGGCAGWSGSQKGRRTKKSAEFGVRRSNCLV